MAATTAEDFHLEQLKALRGEIDESIKETRTLERYAIAGTGAVWAFLLGNSHKDHSMLWLGWIIPIFFAFFGGMRAHWLHWQMNRLADYIRGAESYLPLPQNAAAAPTAVKPKGWETTIGSAKTPVSKFATLFWGMLLAVNVVVAVLALKS